jgi:hypothetical protein
MSEWCYWSIGTGDYAYMLKYLVHTFRSVGMKEDFIALSDQPIPGAETKLISHFDLERHPLYKFIYIQHLKRLNYKYFVYVDADTVFVRKPPDLSSLISDTPFHSFFDSECTPSDENRLWMNLPLDIYVQLMREAGVDSQKIYLVNGAFFIVQKEAISKVYRLVKAFWRRGLRRGLYLSDEPPIAYALHLLCPNQEKHLLKQYGDIWASSGGRKPTYTTQLPDGTGWERMDFLHGDSYFVNPAMVHAHKSKEILIKAGKNLVTK